jgi:hypothetical protein
MLFIKRKSLVHTSWEGTELMNFLINICVSKKEHAVTGKGF